MKRLTWLSLCMLCLTFCARPAAAQTKESAGFAKMKTLVGEWEGKAEDGKAIQVSYRLVSGGTALMEMIHPADEADMVTVYTADGDRVAVTHYCSANNQPRMQTAPISSSPQKLEFSFVGATNLAGPTAGHMHHLAVKFENNDHFTQNWTWRDNGKDKIETFHLVRKKSS
jgi:hypothetical protein